MKRLLVINLGWEQEPLLDKLGEYEVEIYGIHYDKNYYKKPRYKDVFITDLRDLEKILNYARNNQIEAVISDECDYSYFAQALVAENLKLLGPRIAEAQIATNKYLQRLKAKETALLIPEFSLVTSIKDIHEFCKKVDFPIIVKPVDNRGSFGVNKISNESELEKAYIDALINSHSRLVIVEKFIEGIHITVDGYIFNKEIVSLAVASKDKLKDKNFIIDEKITYPADFSEDLYKKAIKNSNFVASELGFDFGFIHGEYIIDKNENIYLTEIANRGGGVYTSELILSHYVGIDILDFYIKDCLNIEYDFSKIDIIRTPTVMKFFQFSNQKDGIIKTIHGVDEIENSRNVLKLKVLVKKGDFIGSIKSGADRHGVIIVSTEKLEDLNNNLNSLIDKLKVEIE